MNTIPLSSNLSSRRSATGTSVEKEATANQHVLKDYLKRRNLILALIRREIERLSTWHNSLARPDLNFTGLDLLVNWANQTVFTERSWRDLVRLAWHISPDIAVFLPARYGEIFSKPILWLIVASSQKYIIGFTILRTDPSNLDSKRQRLGSRFK